MVTAAGASEEAIPWRFSQTGLGDLDEDDDNRDAIELARSWLAELSRTGEVPRWGILLTGDPGVGKTAVACALGVDALRVGVDVRFISVPDYRALLVRRMELADVIRKLSTVTDETPELVELRVRTRRLWEYRNECDLLILDDLGRELGSSSGRWMEETVDGLIRHRGDQGRATVITSNLQRKSRISRYGEPFNSYLYDVTRMALLRGEDRRRAER